MLNLRMATAGDVAVIAQFIRELAAYERAPEQAVLTEADLLRDGFRGQPKFHVLLAEWEQKPAGFALYFYNYSTWVGRPGIFLEDLFVHPEFRGRGIGKALVRRLAQIAAQEKCFALRWQVLDWNELAIRFYRALGAEITGAGWISMKVAGEALYRLADERGRDAE